MQLFSELVVLFFIVTGQQSHGSRHACHICTGYREDQHGAFPGDDRGRWKRGSLRTYNSNMADYNGFKLRTEGMPWEQAKEHAKDFNNCVREPIRLHENGDLPFLHYIMFDPLHCIK